MSYHTVAKDLKKVIKKIEKILYVTKVKITVSESCRHRFSPGKFKIQRIVESGIRAKGFTGYGVQYFYIYIEPVSKISQVVQEIERMVEHNSSGQITS